MEKIITKIFNKAFIPLITISIFSMIFNKELLNIKYINIARYILLILLLISFSFEIVKLFKRK